MYQNSTSCTKNIFLKHKFRKYINIDDKKQIPTIVMVLSIHYFDDFTKLFFGAKIFNYSKSDDNNAVIHVNIH